MEPSSVDLQSSEGTPRGPLDDERYLKIVKSTSYQKALAAAMEAPPGCRPGRLSRNEGSSDVVQNDNNAPKPQEATHSPSNPKKPKGKGQGKKDKRRGNGGGDRSGYGFVAREETPAEKAESLSKANRGKGTHIQLEVKLKPEQFLALASGSELPLVNGTKSSEHAVEAAHRQMLIASVLWARRRVPSEHITDIQGKARATYIHDGVARAYPHICREQIVARDVVWGVTNDSHSITECTGYFTTSMSVDVLTKVTPEMVAMWCDRTNDREHFAIYHDYLRHCPEGVALVPTTEGLRFVRDIPGHKDTETDLYQSWLWGSSYRLPDGRVLVWNDWGPQFGSHCILQFKLARAENLATDPIFIGNFWEHMRRGLPSRSYTFSDPLSDDERVVDVGNRFVVFRGGTKEVVLSRATIAGIVQLLGPSVITPPLLRMAIRQFKAIEGSAADKLTLVRLVDSLITVDNSASLGRAWQRLDLVRKLFKFLRFGQNIDDKAKEQRIVGQVLVDDMDDQPSGWQVSVKTAISVIRSVPHLLAVFPLMVVLYVYWKRRREFPAIFPGAAEAALTSAGIKYDPWFWPLFGSMVSKPNLSWHERFRLWWGSTGSSLAATGLSIVAKLTPLVSLALPVGKAVAKKFAASAYDPEGFTHLCVVTPVVEELVKEAGAYGLRLAGSSDKSAMFTASAIFGISEFGGAVWSGLPILSRAVPLGVHVFLGCLGLKGPNQPTLRERAWAYLRRVAYHGSYNFGVWMRTAKDGGGHKPDQVEYPGYEMPPSTALKPMARGASIKVIVAGVEVPHDNLARLSSLDDKDKPMLFLNTISCARRPYVQASTIVNLVVGLRNRALLHTPGSKNNHWAAATECIPEQMFQGVHWYSFEEWNARYPAQQAKANEKALEEYLAGTGQSVWMHRFKPFLKQEMNHSVEGDLKDPRVIHQWLERASTAISGPFCWSVAEHMRKFFCGDPMVNKYGQQLRLLVNSGLGPNGESQSQRFANFIEESLPWVRSADDGAAAIAVSGDDNFVVCKLGGNVYVVTTDGKRWDVHLDKWAHYEEVEMHVKCALQSHCRGIHRRKGDDFITIWMWMVFDVFAGAKAGKYSVVIHKSDVRVAGAMPPSKHSGCAWTTSGNNYLNMSSCARCVWKGSELTRGLDRASRLERVKSHFTEHWSGLGMPIEIGVYDDVSHADFCSMRLVPVAGKHYAVPLLGKFLLRFGWSVGSRRTPGELRAVIDQLRAFSNVPFMGSLIKAADRLVADGDKLEESEFLLGEKYKAYWGIKELVPSPSSDTWEWLLQVYGVTPGDAAWFDNVCSSIPSLPWELPSGPHELLVKRDC